MYTTMLSRPLTVRFNAQAVLFCAILISGTTPCFARQWIGFYAVKSLRQEPQEPTMTGHAFISIIHENSQLQQTTAEFYGFYPNVPGQILNAISPFRLVQDGEVRNDMGTYPSVSFIVEVNLWDLSRVRDRVEDWKTRDYNLALNNCVHFMEDVASQIDQLVHPFATGQWPYGYVDSLKILNRTFGVTDFTTFPAQYLFPTYSTPVEQPDPPSGEPLPELVASHRAKFGTKGEGTPDKLGRKLLDALRTNDLETWLCCIDPEASPQNQVYDIKAFDILRKRIEGGGITDWSLIEYSRTTFENEHKHDDGGRRNLTDVQIEFYYRNRDFIGRIGFNNWSDRGGKLFVNCITTDVLRFGMGNNGKR